MVEVERPPPRPERARTPRVGPAGQHPAEELLRARTAVAAVLQSGTRSTPHVPRRQDGHRYRGQLPRRPMPTGFGHPAPVDGPEPLPPAVVDRHRPGRRFPIARTAPRNHHPVPAARPRRPVLPGRFVGSRQQFDESVRTGRVAGTSDPVPNGGGDATPRFHGPTDAVPGTQRTRPRVRLVVRRPAADAPGRRRRRPPRDNSRAQLPWPHARPAGFPARVHAAPPLERTEERAAGVRRLVASAVRLASQSDAGRAPRGGRFRVAVGVRDDLTPDLTQDAGALAFEGEGRGGRRGSRVEPMSGRAGRVGALREWVRPCGGNGSCGVGWRGRNAMHGAVPRVEQRGASRCAEMLSRRQVTWATTQVHAPYTTPTP